MILQILQAFLPHMQEQRRGHIVALSSVAGLTGIKDQVPLSVSQFAVKVSNRVDICLFSIHFYICFYISCY